MQEMAYCEWDEYDENWLENEERVEEMLENVEINGEWWTQDAKKILDKIERYRAVEIQESQERYLSVGGFSPHTEVSDLMEKILNMIDVPWMTAPTRSRLYEINAPLWMKFDMKRILKMIDQSWGEFFIDQFDTEHFRELWQFIVKETENETVYPQMHQVFSAFFHCPLDEVKVVILGQDPYYNDKHGPEAHGLCFSIRSGVGKLPPSLNFIFNELEREGFTRPTSGNLSGWAEQGVLLLNTALTVPESSPGKHIREWKIFTDAVIRLVTQRRQCTVIMLWGRKAQEKKSLMVYREYVLEATHPSARYNNTFRNCNHFSETNQILIEANRLPIDWSRTSLTMPRTATQPMVQVVPGTSSAGCSPICTLPAPVPLQLGYSNHTPPAPTMPPMPTVHPTMSQMAMVQGGPNPVPLQLGYSNHTPPAPTIPPMPTIRPTMSQNTMVQAGPYRRIYTWPRYPFSG